MIVKIVAVRVVVPDRDVAGEVHHADHHREARDGGDHRGRHARAAQDLAQRRGGRFRLAGSAACACESSFGSGRTPNEISEAGERRRAPAASHGTTSSCGVSARPANIGPKTSGPQIAPETTPKRTIDMPRARRSGGNISAAAARESRTIDCAAPQSAEPEEDEHAGLERAARGGDDRARDPEHEPGADHRHPADAVGDPPRRPDGERAGDQEDGRAEAEDALRRR